MLRDPPAQAVVGEQIVQAAAEAEDVLLVYYAGHGEMTWDQTNELCLTLRDTRSSSLRTSALRCADLRQYIRNSRARTRVLILDCCFGGQTIADTMTSAAGTVLSSVDVAGAYVLAATHELALAPAESRHTLFTGELLRLLREGVATEPGLLLTLDALFREVKSTMHRSGLPEPCSNHSDTAASLAIAHNAAHKIRQALGGLRVRVEQLAAAEAKTDLAYARVIDKIARPNLPPLRKSADVLSDRLTRLDRSAVTGRPPSEKDIDLLGSALDEAMTTTRQLHDLAVSPVDWRDQLRGKLASYREMAVRLGVAEDAAIAERYVAARDLLWVKPCELGAATRAVNAYQLSVIDRRERHG